MDGHTGSGVLSWAIRSRLWLLLGGSALLVSWQACEALVPVFVGQIVQRAIGTGDTETLVGWIVGLAALFTILSLSYRFGARLATRAAELVGHDLRVRIARAVLDPARRADDDQRAGTLLTTATIDTTRVGTTTQLVPRAAAACASVLVIAIVLLRISLSLGVVVLVGAPLLMAAIAVVSTPLERRAAVEQAHTAEAAAVATDLVTGLRVLGGIGAQDTAADRYVERSRRTLTAVLRSNRAESALTGASLTLTGLFLAVVTLVSGRLAAQGRIDIGDLIAVVGLAQFLTGPLNTLTQVGTVRARGRASAQRIAAVLASTPHEPAVENHLAGGRLELREIDSGPLRELSLLASRGEIVGVAAGPAEAAELVAVLAGTLPPPRGAFLVDGQDVADCSVAALRRVVLAPPHEAPLFAGTVAGNVSVAASGPAMVAAAIRASDTDQVGEVLPEGLATAVAERGSSLSGGQRQRVALGRALAADAPILVLHDPTTAVDTVTEARIAAQLQEIRAGRATILVTTSPALLARCDRVTFIDAGTGVSATHADLLERSAAYRELVFG